MSGDFPVASAAPPTPAAQVVKLRQEISYLQRDLEEAKAKASRAEERLARFTVLSKTSFAGIEMAQSWCEFVLWEGLLNDGNFKAVFELGTWEGGFAAWLNAQCAFRQMAFYTYDVKQPRESNFWKPNEPPLFVKADIFAEAGSIIERMLSFEPLVLFCDNGNKPRELKTFGTALVHPDSRVVVHDWGTEVQPEDVPEQLEMVHREFCEELGSMSRVFKRKENDV